MEFPLLYHVLVWLVSIGAGKTLQVPVVVKQVSSKECKKSKGGKGLKRKKNKENKPAKALKTSKEELKKKYTDHDELDQLARMRCKRQRCVWTPKEDNFVSISVLDFEDKKRLQSHLGFVCATCNLDQNYWRTEQV